MLFSEQFLSNTGMHMGMRRHHHLTATATVEDTPLLTLGVVLSLTGVPIFQLIDDGSVQQCLPSRCAQ